MHKNIWFILVAFCLNSRLVWSMEITNLPTSQQLRLLKRIARNPATPIEVLNVPPELKDRFTPVVVRKSILSLLHALNERCLEDAHTPPQLETSTNKKKKKKKAQISLITVDQSKLFMLHIPSQTAEKVKKKKKQKTPKQITFVYTANAQEVAEGTQLDTYIEAFKEALNTQPTNKLNEVLVTIDVKKLITLLQQKNKYDL